MSVNCKYGISRNKGHLRAIEVGKYTVLLLFITDYRKVLLNLIRTVLKCNQTFTLMIHDMVFNSFGISKGGIFWPISTKIMYLKRYVFNTDLVFIKTIILAQFHEDPIKMNLVHMVLCRPTFKTRPKIFTTTVILNKLYLDPLKKQLILLAQGVHNCGQTIVLTTDTKRSQELVLSKRAQLG